MAAKIGTNTNDPQTSNARLFVGNLNTFALSQNDVEQIFRRYGFVAGISIHKGFAFIQYTSEHEARMAINGENGKTYANQQVDINLCSESKPKRAFPSPTPLPHNPTNAYVKPPPIMGRINRDLSKLPQLPQPQRMGGPPPKKLCQDFQDFSPVSSGIRRTLVTLSDNSSLSNHNQSRRLPPPTTSAAVSAAVKAAAAASVKPILRATARSATGSPLSNQDILICGVCKLEFTNLHTLAQHKKLPCKLRFSCQCQKSPQPETELEALMLNCATCNMTFFSAWTLVQHCQTEHELTIYKDGRKILDDAKGTTVKIDAPKNDTAAQNNDSNSSDVKAEPKE